MANYDIRNVALHAPCTASSIGGFSSENNKGDPNNATDGITEYKYGGFTHLAHTGGGSNEWWQVDLGSLYPIVKIRLWVTHGNTAEPSNVHFFISRKPFHDTYEANLEDTSIFRHFHPGGHGKVNYFHVNVPGTFLGRYVRVQKQKSGQLFFIQVEVLAATERIMPLQVMAARIAYHQISDWKTRIPTALHELMVKVNTGWYERPEKAIRDDIP